MMAESLVYSCNMCSYNTQNLESLTSHVCKIHKNDPRFHIYCESCLRSYTKWDSYRKHIQRGCMVMPSGSNTSVDPSFPLTSDDNEGLEELDIMDVDSDQHEHSNAITQKDWYEALYILSIKEKYILSQVAVDEVVSCTKTLVSDILHEIMDDVCGNLPAETMEMLQNKIENVNDTLFKRMSSASLQRKYFKKYFNLVVSKI